MPADGCELEDDEVDTDVLDDDDSELRDDELLTDVLEDDDNDDFELDELFDVDDLDDGNEDEDLELLDLLDTVDAQAEPVTMGFSAALLPLFPWSPNSIVCPGFTILFQLRLVAE